MDFLKELEDNSILIVPSIIKNKILDYIDNNNLLINVKLSSFNEFKKGLLFDYTNEALYKVMQIKNVTLETAKDFVENLYYLNESSYEDNKLNELLEIKKELENNNLLIKNELFIDLLKSKSKVYVYGFTVINKFNDYLISLIKNYKDVEIINKNNYDYKHEVIELKNIEDEVQYVAEHIAELIQSGVPMDHIYIANYSEEYYYPINKIFSLYGIPIYLKGTTKLSDTAMGNYFINNLSNDMEKLLNKIKAKYDVDNNKINNKVFNKLFNLVNSYYWADSYLDIKELIEEEMKTVNISNDHFENEITTIDIIDNIFLDDEYVFLLGFNTGSIPKTYKDEDYIEDSIKTPLMETTLDKNIKNLTITYKDVSTTSKYLPSSLIDGNYLYKNEDNIKSTYSNYSSKYNKTLYASRLDDLIKFNEEHDDNQILHSTYDIDYKTYNNNFTGINKDKIKDRLEEKGYSYSSVSHYFECPFKYYLNVFFKLEEYTSTFSTLIGGAFHRVLELCLNDDTLDFNEIYDNFIEENKKSLPYGHKEEYFVNDLRNELEFILNTVKEQQSNMIITDEWHEKEKEFDAKDLGLNVNIAAKIKGVVDKCIFNGNDVIIVDYKTGSSAKIKRDYFEYGVTIQLPIYLFLLKNINKDFNILGMYLQHILEGLVYKKDNKTYEQTKIDRLKLDGLTLDDMSKLDKTLIIDKKEKLIKGIQIKLDGTYQYPQNIITYEDQDKIYDMIKNLLEDCINNTVDGKYDIAPIKDKNVNGCDYCSYKDICYVKADNYNYINGNTEEIDASEEGEEDA